MTEGSGMSVPLMENLRRPSQMYMLEFVIFHLFLLAALSFITYILSASVASLLGEGMFLFGYELPVYVYLLMGLLITLPVVLVTAPRLRLREATEPSVKDSKVRRFFLYFFLLIYFVSIAWTLGVVLGALLQNLITIGAGADWGKSFWVGLVSPVVTLGLSKLAFLYVYKEGQSAQVNSLFTPVLILIGVVAAGLLIAFPIRQSRGSISDTETVSDIYAIQSAVQDYASDKSELPNSLSDVSLKGDVAGRVDKYEYRTTSSDEYEICATFKSDAQESDLYGYSSDDDPSSHGKGRDCFTDSVYIYEDYDYNYDSESDFNFPQ